MAHNEASAAAAAKGGSNGMRVTRVGRVEMRPGWRGVARLGLAGMVLGAAMGAATRAGAQEERRGGFTILGPGGGGATFAAAVSATDPNVVAVGSDMSGSYVTHDGGRSWHLFNLLGRAHAFAFDPKDAKVMYAAGTGLWRSRDGGLTWDLILPQPGQVVGYGNSSDEADVGLVVAAGPGVRRSAPEYTAMATDPRDGRLWVAVSGVGEALWRSDDQGAHWKEVTTTPGRVDHLAVGADGLWGAGPRTFWRLEGKKLVAMSRSSEDYWKQTAIDPPRVGTSGPALLLGVHANELYVAHAAEGGASEWKRQVLPGEGAKVVTAASGHDNRTILVSFEKMKLDGAEWAGLARSEDGGEHWTIVRKETATEWPKAPGDWIAETVGTDGYGEPRSFAVSVSDPKVMYLTDYWRVMKSEDGGLHWAGVYARVNPDGSASGIGVDETTSWETVFDPFDAKRIFVAYTDIGLTRSEDGGQTWRTSLEGIPQAWRNTAYSVVFDPAVKGKVWGAFSGQHDLPRPRTWRKVSPETFLGGVAMSGDGGRTWEKSNQGMHEGAATQVLLDPRSPVGRRTLYAAVFGRGVYKSVDDGHTWRLENAGMRGEYPLTYRLALASDGTLYAVDIRPDLPGAFHATNEGSLWRSRDGAEHWERVELPHGVTGPNGITVDPRDPERLYLAAWPAPLTDHGAYGGIYLSTDAGAHWREIFRENQHVFDVTYNPANPDELYATGFESSAWISEDMGAHWRRIAGYDFLRGQRVIADPVRPGWVYVNTFGGGVWHGRTDAKPEVEELLMPRLAPATR